jgi:hypothetical protein
MRAVETSEKVPYSSKKEPDAEPVPPITPVSPPTGLSADRSTAGIYSDSLQEAPGQQETAPPASFAPETGTRDQEPDSNVIPVDEGPGLKASDITASQVSESISLDREIPPPRNPRSRIKPGKRTVYAGVVIVIIIAVIFGGFFLYPLISKGGQIPASTSASPTTIPGTQIPSGNIVTLKVTPVVTVPAEGIYVHIKYIGGWKGSYGIPSDLKTVTNSGDRYYPVENATGIVQASFGKLDSSTKQTLLVEILRNGQVLTSGNTTAGFGTVTLSVDTVTGVAKAPEISTGGVVTTVTTTRTNQT